MLYFKVLLLVGNMLRTITLLILLTFCNQSIAKYKEGYISFEVKTDTVFKKVNEHNSIYPASITKLMTAFIILRDHEDLDTQVEISKNAWGHRFSNSSRMFLEPNMKVSLRQLLNGLLIQSGNDSATALAEFHSGSVKKFVTVMNSTAKKIGMKNTNFENPHGRHHKKHRTTAFDMMLLVKVIFAKTPKMTEFTRKHEFEFNDILQWNRNRTLKTQTSVGLKTGFTPQSGFNLAACYEINEGIFCTIQFGAKSIEERYTQSINAYNEVFKHREVYSLKLPFTQIDLDGVSYQTETADTVHVLGVKGLRKSAILKLNSHVNGKSKSKAIVEFTLGDKQYPQEVELIKYNQTDSSY